MHRDTRDIAFQQLQTVLAAKDMDLARLQQGHAELSSEVADLRRTSRREGVNMDYLKNIVMQFMMLPMAAPERMSLVPVIATLLQFSTGELIQVENSMRSPVWTTLPVKEVKRGSGLGVASPARRSQSAPPHGPTIGSPMTMITSSSLGITPERSGSNVVNN